MDRDFFRENWELLTAPAALILLGLAAVISPRNVYDGFIWKYFWGPVVADAANQATAVFNGVVAYRGYNVVNEIGYGLLLVYSIFLLITLLRRLDIGEDRGFILSFVPFIVGGGLLRVVEDAGILSVPWRYLVISPVIYITLFVIVLAVILAAVLLERRGVLKDYLHGVAAGGTVFGLVVAAILLLQNQAVAAWMLPASLGVAGLVFAPSYGLVRYVRLERLRGWETGTVMFSHLLDGSATALSIDFLGYGEKHPLVDFIINFSGTAYTFLGVKLLVIGGILYYMDEEVREEDPLMYNLVMLGILAVGLGPGVRNTVRAVLGV